MPVSRLTALLFSALPFPCCSNTRLITSPSPSALPAASVCRQDSGRRRISPPPDAQPCPALPCPACTALPLLTPILVIAGAYRYKAAALTCSAVSECLVSSHKAASCLTTHVASANCRNNDELPPLWLGSWIGQGEHGTVGLPASPTGPPQQPTRNTACVRVRGVRGRAREGGGQKEACRSVVPEMSL